MKRSLSINIIAIIAIAFITQSCNKEGLGGTSSIEGSVTGIDHDDAESEITQVSFTNGNAVEHGDYWLLNSPDLNNYFYIWYDNPSWITNGDPGLAGRIGIQVTFNYTDSNIDIATNTMTAISNTTPIFNMNLNNDILMLECTIKGDCPDAEDVTSPFSFDIANQGQDSFLGTEQAVIDEKVYIKYGESTIYNDIARTSDEGKFIFRGLQKGNYTLYAFSKDTITGTSVAVEKTIEITSNREDYTIEDFVILY